MQMFRLIMYVRDAFNYYHQQWRAETMTNLEFHSANRKK